MKEKEQVEQVLKVVTYRYLKKGKWKFKTGTMLEEMIDDFFNDHRDFIKTGEMTLEEYRKMVGLQ